MAEDSFLVKNKEIFTQGSLVGIKFPYFFWLHNSVFVSKDTCIQPTRCKTNQ